MRRGQRAIEVGAGGVGQLAEDFLGRRVDDILFAPVASLDEFPIDIEGEILVHACLLSRSGRETASLTRRAGTRTG
ncbi:hypothetical protein D3C72_2323670 [compost metagenome]